METVQGESTQRTIPALEGSHHIGLTVSNVEVSEEWYRRVLGCERLMLEPHNGGTGYTVLIHRPGTSLDIGLDHHVANAGETFEEHRTGLDHLAMTVERRDDLDQWVAHLDRLNVQHGDITDREQPFRYSTLAFRDPDNIQLEFIWLGQS